ncbi:MAG TPA: cob(I)yrinic acid a,c-diamide adenosyltransferase [Longimicrobiaceae bacterium]|nr:cob(I)yrinic acid a,c-diamide adenosyltransferase [Longimicrobiaceae bacterium]
MKIYTRTGDSGETALFGGGRVRKDHLRVEAYGEVDELNAVLGFVAAAAGAAGAGALLERIHTVQEDLFAIGAHLATPDTAEKAASHLPPLPVARIAQMEGWIDEADARLTPLRNFILPGGTETAARLHLARATCRRAERRVAALLPAAPIDGGILMYLNRLSDLLFTWARTANRDASVEDVPWRGRS